MAERPHWEQVTIDSLAEHLRQCSGQLTVTELRAEIDNWWDGRYNLRLDTGLSTILARLDDETRGDAGAVAEAVGEHMVWGPSPSLSPPWGGKGHLPLYGGLRFEEGA